MDIVYNNQYPAKDQFYQLFESTGWNREYQVGAEDLHQALQHSWYQVSALHGDELVGYGRVISDGVLHAFIVEMIVLPEWQGRGIGKQIIERLIDRCRQAGIRDIQLFCAQGKAGFYEKHGFRPRPESAPGMEIRLSQELTQSTSACKA